MMPWYLLVCAKIVLNAMFCVSHIAPSLKGGDEKSRTRHVAKGKMMVRDRIDALLDPGTAFLELSPLAGHDM